MDAGVACALYLSAFSSSFRTPRFENTKEKVRDPIVCSCIARFHFFFERRETPDGESITNEVDDKGTFSGNLYFESYISSS